MAHSDLSSRPFSGLKRKTETYDPTEADEVLVFDEEERKKRMLDPILQLEHGVVDEKKSKQVRWCSPRRRPPPCARPTLPIHPYPPHARDLILFWND